MAKSTKKSPAKTKTKKVNIFKKIWDWKLKTFKYVFSKKFVNDVKKKVGSSPKLLKTVGIVLLFVVSFVVVDFFVQYLNNGYSVAIVNGARIPRQEYLQRLEKAYGLDASSRLVEEKLIVQGAKQEGVTVSQEEVLERVNQYYEENGGKDSVLLALKANNLSEKDLFEQVNISLLAEGVLEKQVTYTDEELKTFFDQYKSYLYTEENPKFDEKKSEIEQYYVSQKVSELRDGWITELRSKSKIQDNVASKPTYGLLKTTTNIFTNLYSQFKNVAEKE